MRCIVLDTETTGFEPTEGHCIVEIGCIETRHLVPTGKVYHTYINPQRDMPQGAFEVHGLSEEFLKQHPIFSEIVDDFLTFIGDDPLIIHNAPFDMKFLNAELRRLSYPSLSLSRAVDTLRMAREKFPGAPASLDALCKRFKIDNSKRQKHGALLDAELLAEVYIELSGGRQANLSLENIQIKQKTLAKGMKAQDLKGAPKSVRPHEPLPEELALHQKLMQKIHGKF